MALDLAPIGAEVLKNPLVAGAVAKFLVDFIRSQLKTVDESGQLVKHKGAVQPIVYGLTVLTAILSAGMEGNAQAFDPSALGSFIVQMAIGALGTHQAIKGGAKAVEAAKAKVVGK